MQLNDVVEKCLEHIGCQIKKINFYTQSSIIKQNPFSLNTF